MIKLFYKFGSSKIVIFLMTLSPKWFIRIVLKLIATRFRNIANHRNFPHRLTFFVTNRCNLHCAHCFFSSEVNKKMPHLSVDNISAIATSLRSITKQLVITGGEPLLREDLAEICRIFALKTGLNEITIISNGSLPDKTQLLVEQSSRHGITLHFQISIDGVSSFHDANRGKVGAFDNAFETINLLKQKKKKGYRIGRIVTATAISNANFADLPKLIEWFKDNQIDALFTFVRDTPKIVFGLDDKRLLNDFSPSKPNLCLDRSSVQQCLELLTDQYWSKVKPSLLSLLNRATLQMMYEKQALGVPCTGGLADVVVFSDGQVAPCEMVKPFATLGDFDYDFRRLWNTKYPEYQRKLRNCRCLHDCNISSYYKLHLEQLVDSLDIFRNISR